MHQFQEILRILILIVASILLMNKIGFSIAARSRADRIALVLLGVMALVSIAGYFRFGNLHQYGKGGTHLYHYHDFFHYGFGAKYYSELGYYGLYDCTNIAFKELEQSGEKIPKVRNIRSLERYDRAYSLGYLLHTKTESCHKKFSKERWQDFKQDLKTYLDLGFIDHYWKVMFFDLGFNPPPTWALFGEPLINSISMTANLPDLLPLIDIILIFVIAPFFVWRTFGVYPFLAFVIFLGNNWLSHFGWTGGSYLRQTWFFFLVLGICCLKERRLFWAGGLLGLSSAARLFPVLFFIGALVPMLYQAWKSRSWRASFRFIMGFSAVMGTCLILSVTVYGMERWWEFLENIRAHSRGLFVMHIGFTKYAMFTPDIGGQNFWWVGGLRRFFDWQKGLYEVYNQKIIWWTFIKFTAVAFTFFALRKSSPYLSSLVVGGSILFFFFIPANYYYVYFALLPVLFFQVEGHAMDVCRLALAGTLMVLIPMMPFLVKDDIIYNGYINTLVFWYFMILPLTFYLEPCSDQEPEVTQQVLSATHTD
jgi:hypothetical protein